MNRFNWIVILLLVLHSCGLQQTSDHGVYDPPPVEELFKWNDQRTPLISAHRGGSYRGYPENCLETFDFVAAQYPVLIECDVARAEDGTLVLMHDETLDRTTTGSGPVSEQTWEQLSNLRLVDDFDNVTDFRVPRLNEVLEWSRGRALLTLDIKRSVAFEDIINMVESYNAEDRVVMITYTLGAAEKIHRLNAELMLSVTVRNLKEFERLKKSNVALDRVVAFTGTSEPQPELYQALHQEGIYCILGTLGNLDGRARARGDELYLDFLERGADIIATDRPLEVGEIMASQYDLHSVFEAQNQAVTN